MKAIWTVLQEVYGLFVEDGSLAVILLLWIGVLAFVIPRWPGGAAWHAPLLFLGVIVVLLENIWRSAHHKR
ncbi:MAG TPA: hypothetical protein VFB38_00135 [Chthonomonadaceae bacterium]|nr:hypothetical protein [Chthonomonadaceae bacterium]